MADFKVDYGPIPFTIVEQYSKGDAVGLYSKTAKMPGSKLLTLPTVIVDVQADFDGNPYDRIILYSCLDVLDAVPIVELVFITRVKSPSDTYLAAMEKTARDLGVSWDSTKLKVTDQT